MTPLLFLLVFFPLYMAPAIAAYARGIDGGKAAFALLVNIFLGWTVLGWFFALGIALMSQPIKRKYT